MNHYFALHNPHSLPSLFVKSASDGELLPAPWPAALQLSGTARASSEEFLPPPVAPRNNKRPGFADAHHARRGSDPLARSPAGGRRASAPAVPRLGPSHAISKRHAAALTIARQSHLRVEALEDAKANKQLVGLEESLRRSRSWSRSASGSASARSSSPSRSRSPEPQSELPSAAHLAHVNERLGLCTSVLLSKLEVAYEQLLHIKQQPDALRQRLHSLQEEREDMRRTLLALQQEANALASRA